MNKWTLIMSSILSVIISIVFYFLHAYDYMIVFIALAIVAIITTIYYLNHHKTEEDSFNYRFDKLINTYDNIFIKMDSLPDIKDKSIVIIEDIFEVIAKEDENNHHIYYDKGNNTYTFIIIDNDEAFIAFHRLNNDDLCPYEKEIRDLKLSQETPKVEENQKEEMLNDLDNTTIIKLNDDREFKISPIKKKKEINIAPSSCMIDKEKIYLTLKDHTTLNIAFASIQDIKDLPSNNSLTELSIITEDADYLLSELNPKKMNIIKKEIQKRLL